ncbi:hypothetical protein ACWCPL_23230, partial [Streptomyces sp. NPDC001948]
VQGVELRLVADDGSPVGPGEVGELAIRGTNVLPDADVESFRGWLADVTAGEAGLELGGEAYGDA